MKKKFLKLLKKAKRFALKNKLLSILIILFVLIFIMFLVFIKVLIFPSYKVSKYGNRLEDISSVKLNDSRFNEIKSSLNLDDNITLSKFRLSGRIVNITLVAGDVDVNAVKENSNKIIDSFNEEEKNYYDFQIFVTSNNSEDDKYPMIGYKNKKSTSLSWNYEGEN